MTSKAVTLMWYDIRNKYGENVKWIMTARQRSHFSQYIDFKHEQSH